MTHPLDQPQIINNLFFVRKTPFGGPTEDHVFDGHIPITDDVSLGYRLYRQNPNAPLLLYFHGNGEIASDYDTIAPFYAVAGVSLLVVDYRGYGWSTGTPLASTLLTDAEAVYAALPDLLRRHGVGAVPLFVKGRSLGSGPATYVAYHHAADLRGLMVDSGYADAPSLFRRLQIKVPDEIAADVTLPINNLNRIAGADLPLLVLHGQNDQIIPADHARRMYHAAPTTDKHLHIIDGAGHNDLLTRDISRYFGAVRDFVQSHL